MLRLTFNPFLKKFGNGLRSYVRKRALFDSGDIAIYHRASARHRRKNDEERGERKWTHSDLLEVEEVLKSGNLPQ